jgi:hypothetical protein
MAKSPLWRVPFDLVERPITKASQSLLESDAYMDRLSIAWRLRGRVNAELRRGLGVWLGAWNLSSRSDIDRIANQLAGLERQVRELRKQLEPGEPAGNENGNARRRPSTRGRS